MQSVPLVTEQRLVLVHSSIKYIKGITYQSNADPIFSHYVFLPPPKSGLCSCLVSLGVHVLKELSTGSTDLPWDPWNHIAVGNGCLFLKEIPFGLRAQPHAIVPD